MTGSAPILVTGAGGLVGGAVCRRLASAGLDVVPIVRRRDAGVPGAIVADLRTDSLGDAIGPMRPAAVVHCAALVPTNPLHPDSVASADGTRAVDANVHETAARTAAHLVYLSTCGLYDAGDPAVKDEGSEVRGRTPYFAAKLDGERLFGGLGRATILRLSSPAGPSMPPHLVLPRFVAAALRGEALSVWGSGSREQDFIHVDDVAELIRLAVIAGPVGTCNVASGAPVSMRTLAEAVVAAVGSGSVVLAGRPDPQEGATARYSVAAALERLGWRPAVTLAAMARGLAEALGEGAA